MDHQLTQIGANFNHSICKVWNCGKKSSCYVIRCIHRWSRWCSHKIFHCQQMPAYLRSWIQLNFAGKPAVNAWNRLWYRNKCSHIPYGVPGHAGSYVPGMLAAYENNEPGLCVKERSHELQMVRVESESDLCNTILSFLITVWLDTTFSNSFCSSFEITKVCCTLVTLIIKLSIKMQTSDQSCKVYCKSSHKLQCASSSQQQSLALV